MPWDEVEVHDLRAQARLYLSVHLVACLHQGFGQLHVLRGDAVVGPQSQGPGQETHQVVLGRGNNFRQQRPRTWVLPHSGRDRVNCTYYLILEISQPQRVGQNLIANAYVQVEQNLTSGSKV